MNPRRPRIAITPEALRAARVLAALRSMEPSDYLSALIIREYSRELGDLKPTRSLPDAPKPTESQPDRQTSKRLTKVPISQVPGQPERILELAAQGKGPTEIGRLVGRSPKTIFSWLQNRREKDINDKL